MIMSYREILEILAAFITVLVPIVTVIWWFRHRRKNGSRGQENPLEFCHIDELFSREPNAASLNGKPIRIPYVKRSKREWNGAGTGGRRILIIGHPQSGKTREAIELIEAYGKKLGADTVLSPRYLDIPSELPEIKYDGRRGNANDLIFFFDDLQNKWESRDFTYRFEETIKFLENHCRSLLVVATARKSGFEDIAKKNSDFWNTFHKIELLDFDENETRSLLERTLETFDLSCEDKVKEDIVKTRDGKASTLVLFLRTKAEEKRHGR